MTPERRLGILGGTFDPVHNGHLDAADAARNALGLDEVLFVPSADPPHRSAQPRATTFHRFALIALAVLDHSAFRVSDVELTRPGRSYTADTLRDLQGRGWRASQLFFIIGSDAFADIATWREYPAIVEETNFVVIARPGTVLDRALIQVPELRTRVRSWQDGPESEARTSVFLVEARTRDVSSTSIRARVAAGQSIDDCVPASVAHHIAVHSLYGTEDNLHG